MMYMQKTQMDGSSCTNVKPVEDGMMREENYEIGEHLSANLELCSMCNENYVEQGICVECEETLNRLDTVDYMKSSEGYRISVGFSIMNRSYYTEDEE